MIDVIKNQLWKALEQKEVSLVLIFNKKGKILWSKGRKIVGKDVFEGDGFSHTLIEKCLKEKNIVKQNNIQVSIEQKMDALPASAAKLDIKSIYIQPLENDLFLYLDSGTKSEFTEGEKDLFKSLGELLSNMILTIKNQENDQGGITGTSPPVEKLREAVLKYSIEEDPVLLLGESGSGKTHVAELIHQYSGRTGKFITVNTPGIPENLFESEVFGYKKGAFTDAQSDKPGLVEEAQGGTLFFDEIAEVPISFQAKLLRFIETQKYFVLGGNQEFKANVRIVAATNVDLELAIEEKKFRSDLYFRLNIFNLTIPPLKERKQDLRTLLWEKKKLLKGKTLGEGFWDAMFEYDWPGNIREAITVLIRLGIDGGNPLTGEDVQKVLAKDGGEDGLSSNKKMDKVALIWKSMKDGESFWDVVKTPYLKRDLNRDQVKEIIQKGLDLTDGKYAGLLPIFNIKKFDYMTFMSFLKNNDLKVKI